MPTLLLLFSTHKIGVLVFLTRGFAGLTATRTPLYLLAPSLLLTCRPRICLLTSRMTPSTTYRRLSRLPLPCSPTLRPPTRFTKTPPNLALCLSHYSTSINLRPHVTPITAATIAVIIAVITAVTKTSPSAHRRRNQAAQQAWACPGPTLHTLTIRPPYLRLTIP